MAATEQQQPTPPSGPPDQSCASCGAALAPDQRYCLACGTRRGEPRVPPPGPPANLSGAPAPAAEPQPPRQSDVSPLAAVIGIALLGGMLLIGVLIGRGGGDDPAPAPIVKVGEATTTGSSPTTTPAEPDSGAADTITSEWPEGTEGFTIQLSTVTQDGATPETVDAAKETAASDGAADAAVLDSDLYSSLPPGNYVIYSGVYTDRKSAEVALEGLQKSFPEAVVVEVASGDETSSTETPEAAEPGVDDLAPGAGGESEIPPQDTQ